MQSLLSVCYVMMFESPLCLIIQMKYYGLLFQNFTHLHETRVYYLTLHHAGAIFCMCLCVPAVPCQSWPAGMSGEGHWYRRLKKLFLDLVPVQSRLLPSHLYPVFSFFPLLSPNILYTRLLLVHRVKQKATKPTVKCRTWVKLLKWWSKAPELEVFIMQ